MIDSFSTSDLVPRLIQIAIEEDLGPKNIDITTRACVPETTVKSAFILSKDTGVFFGHDVTRSILSYVDETMIYETIVSDGEAFVPGQKIAKITGCVPSILSSERIVLNCIQRLSGIATQARNITNKIAPLKTKILDSRKTTPGLRLLEKAAVRAGGGYNHRMGLYDEFLIKNNHIDALGGDICLAIQRCRAFDSSKKLKVEIRNMNELQLALSQSPDGILIDNFSVSALADAVSYVRNNPQYSGILLEASGGITIENVRDYALTGVDEISLGALTHSAKSIDISLHISNE